MEAKIIKFESGKDKIKSKILIEEKEVEIDQVFKVTFIINKDILNYKEDLIAYISVKHTHRVTTKKSIVYNSIAKQIKIPFNSYKEYDQDNICYEVNIYIPNYNEYIYNRRSSIKDPKSQHKKYYDLSDEQYYQIRCSVGVMRESELNTFNSSKVIKEKDILLVGQKNELFILFVMIFIILCCFVTTNIMEYYIIPTDISEDLKKIILSVCIMITFLASISFIDKIFKFRSTIKPKE